MKKVLTISLALVLGTGAAFLKASQMHISTHRTEVTCKELPAAWQWLELSELWAEIFLH